MPVKVVEPCMDIMLSDSFQENSFSSSICFAKPLIKVLSLKNYDRSSSVKVSFSLTILVFSAKSIWDKLQASKHEAPKFTLFHTATNVKTRMESEGKSKRLSTILSQQFQVQ